MVLVVAPRSVAKMGATVHPITSLFLFPFRKKGPLEPWRSCCLNLCGQVDMLGAGWIVVAMRKCLVGLQLQGVEMTPAAVL